MRERLNKHNLSSSYPKGSLVGFQPAGQKPPTGVTHFRTADGSWNNLADPKEGAAGTRFPRNVAASAIRPETEAQLLTPNPREISRRLLTRGRDARPADDEGSARSSTSSPHRGSSSRTATGSPTARCCTTR